MKEIAPVYPLNKDAPVLICWTPPPAYILAPITHYHLRLMLSTSGTRLGETTDVTVSAEDGTCADTSNDAFRRVSSGGVYALAVAAESKLGVSAYTSTRMVVSLLKGWSISILKLCMLLWCAKCCEQTVHTLTWYASPSPPLGAYTMDQ